MKLLEVIQDTITYIVVTVVGGLLAGVTWLVRMVILHQKKIEMLEQEMNHREALRVQDREDLAIIRVKMDATHELLLRTLHPPRPGKNSIMDIGPDSDWDSNEDNG